MVPCTYQQGVWRGSTQNNTSLRTQAYMVFRKIAELLEGFTPKQWSTRIWWHEKTKVISWQNINMSQKHNTHAQSQSRTYTHAHAHTYANNRSLKNSLYWNVVNATAVLVILLFLFLRCQPVPRPVWTTASASLRTRAGARRSTRAPSASRHGHVSTL